MPMTKKTIEQSADKVKKPMRLEDRLDLRAFLFAVIDSLAPQRGRKTDEVNV